MIGAAQQATDPNGPSDKEIAIELADRLVGLIGIRRSRRVLTLALGLVKNVYAEDGHE